MTTIAEFNEEWFAAMRKYNQEARLLFLKETIDRWKPIIRALANHLDQGVSIHPNGEVHKMLIALRQLDEDEQV